MKIGSKLQFEVPDNCKKCTIAEKHQFTCYGQGSICTRCPILISKGEVVLVPPTEFRDDWAECWQDFFKDPKGKTYPDLKF